MPKYILACLLTLGTLAAQNVFAGQAKISFVAGTVKVGTAGKMNAATVETPVASGETVSTAGDSAAILVLEDGSEIKLNANTEFTVKGVAPNAEFNLEKGGVFSKIKKLRPNESFRIHAKTAVMGVRGTHFFAALSKKAGVEADLWMCVHEGSVEVESLVTHQKVAVPEGQGVYIKGGKDITPPKPYSWTKGLNWNMDPKKGNVLNKKGLDNEYSDLLEKDYD